MTFIAPCLLGLEGLVANELRFSGIGGVRAENGRVLFEGGYPETIRANLCSRMAARIQLLLAEFEATDFDTLFEGVKAAPWESFIGKADAFPVKGNSVDSQLASIPACQKIIKKAAAERLKAYYGVDWLEEIGAVHQIQFLIFKNRVTVTLDTTGEALNKRGYRAVSNDAPIKETLAAAMAELSRVREDHTVIDPFCGSGTILIEAAMKAMHMPPGLNRSFAFEQWEQVDPALLEAEREKARAAIRRDCSFRAFGYDISEESLAIARRNAEIAGVADRIVFEKRDITDFSDDNDYSTVITNPPYGERMLDRGEAERIYRVMGRVFERRPHHSYTVISPDERFETWFGRPADKKRKLYNGMMKCNVYMFYK